MMVMQSLFTNKISKGTKKLNKKGFCRSKVFHFVEKKFMVGIARTEKLFCSIFLAKGTNIWDKIFFVSIFNTLEGNKYVIVSVYSKNFDRRTMMEKVPWAISALIIVSTENRHKKYFIPYWTIEWLSWHFCLKTKKNRIFETENSKH